jgi:uncharacterized protein (DUF433 family)
MSGRKTLDVDVTRCVVRDRGIRGGAPVFVGTEVPVQTLLDYLEAGDTVEQFLCDFPAVPKEHAMTVLGVTTRLATGAVRKVPT